LEKQVEDLQGSVARNLALGLIGGALGGLLVGVLVTMLLLRRRPGEKGAKEDKP